MLKNLSETIDYCFHENCLYFDFPEECGTIFNEITETHLD